MNKSATGSSALKYGRASVLKGKVGSAAPLFLRFLCRLSLTLTLESGDVALQKNFSRGDALASHFSRIHQKVDVLAGNLEIFHRIPHAHEFGKFVHNVTGLTSYAIADVVL